MKVRFTEYLYAAGEVVDLPIEIVEEAKDAPGEKVEKSCESCYFWIKDKRGELRCCRACVDGEECLPPQYWQPRNDKAKGEPLDYMPLLIKTLRVIIRGLDSYDARRFALKQLAELEKLEGGE